MGFLSLLRSIEDLLYELMTWLVFYPRTLWRVIRNPMQMSTYSDTEQGDAAADQYVDTLSPPLFLILSILIAHGIELALHARVEVARAAFAQTLLASEENRLFLRCILFSIFPLTYATALVRHRGEVIDRNTLRGPFFSQCYVSGLLALFGTLPTVLIQYRSPQFVFSGLAIGLVILVWFVHFQSRWLRAHLSIAAQKSTTLAIGTLIKAAVINGLVAAVFFT